MVSSSAHFQNLSKVHHRCCGGGYGGSASFSDRGLSLMMKRLESGFRLKRLTAAATANRVSSDFPSSSGLKTVAEAAEEVERLRRESNGRRTIGRISEILLEEFEREKLFDAIINAFTPRKKRSSVPRRKRTPPMAAAPIFTTSNAAKLLNERNLEDKDDPKIRKPIKNPISFDQEVANCIPRKSSKKRKNITKKNPLRRRPNPDHHDHQNHPELPQKFKNYLRDLRVLEESIVLVIRKTLFHSDIDSGLCRFSVPERQVLNEFLTEEEKEPFNDRNNKAQEIEVTVIGPSLKEHSLKLRKWFMSSSSMYVLVCGWPKFVEENKLQEGKRVQLWSFRKGLQLRFAFVVVED